MSRWAVGLGDRGGALGWRPWALALLVVVSGLGLLGGCARGVSPADSRDIRVSGAAPDGAGTGVSDQQRRASVRLELAGLYFGRGQAQTALDEVRQALEARPDMTEAHVMRALILASLGEMPAAEASFKRAIELAPNEGSTLHNHAWFLCQQRRYTEADAQFNATTALPQYRDGVRTLMAQGVCQLRAGRLGDAERSLTRSYELDPANPTTAYNLSDVLLQRGELERARFLIRRVNALAEQVSAQSLWLAARIEKRLGNNENVRDLGEQLRSRFGQTAEASKFDRGAFDD
jgi:type IV pilus assembly protein PilF